MKVDNAHFMEDGFLFIRECIPSGQLESLCRSFEILVDRQRQIWKQERQPDDPPGGVWESGHQPRLWFDQLVDGETEETVEFLLHENTMGVSRQLLHAPDAAVLAMFLMCSPQRDHGPAQWHRDLHPFDQAPLSGLQADMLENAPGLVQWNVPLHDDDVLWVVPGSHRRINTEAENRQLRENPRVPLPHSVPVDLRAGDAVVYTNVILHWGSNYRAKLRRTIHMGYRGFGGPIYPYVPHLYWNPDFASDLSPAVRQSFARQEDLFQAELEHVVALFKAVIERDADRFYAELAVIHPGESRRFVALVQLSKLALKICLKPAAFGYDLMRHEQIAEHFSPTELAALWNRFRPLDEIFKADAEQFVPGFQGGSNRYYYEDMPDQFGAEEFVAGWSIV